MKKINNHSKLVNAILVELSKRPDVRAWKAHAGVAKAMNSNRTIKYGVTGGADIQVCWRLIVKTPRIKNEGGFTPYEYLHPLCVGQTVLIEVKTGKGKQTQVQKDYQAAMEECGAIYVVARSVDDAMKVFPTPVAPV